MSRTASWRRIAVALLVAAVTATSGATAAVAATADPPIVGPTDPPVFDTDAHPAFDWSMPERYDASWAAYRFSTGTYAPEFVTPSTWSIRLDACDSTAVRRITAYVFTVSQIGTSWTRTFSSGTCLTRLDTLPALGAYDVRLTLNTDWGTSVGISAQVRNTATLKDHLLVSMGDSLASGEGNPDVRAEEGVPVQWKDKRCHRSALSGPALAAKAIEAADPHTSVTFVSVACSGARIPHVSQWNYDGIAPQSGFHYPPQVKQVADLVGPDSARGGRRISAILLSAGVNDLFFSNVIRRCAKPITLHDCIRWPDRRANLDGLPASYHRLALEIARQLPDTGRVMVNNYPVHVFNEGGCGVLTGITQAEGHAMAAVGKLLNDAIALAIRRHINPPYRWKAVKDLDGPFTPHPYCGSSTWFTRLEWSEDHQGDQNGTAHPNGPGHRAFAEILHGSLVGVI